VINQSLKTDSLVALLSEVSEFLDPYVDVRDGWDGRPIPNKAMSLQQEVDAVIERLKRNAD
jgi:hypothetical protein